MIMKTQVIFKGQRGSMWITAEVVEKVDGGYILNCGDTKDFFVEDAYIKHNSTDEAIEV
mgnify:CR=1 FL=1